MLYALRSGREPGMRPERPGGPSGHRHTEDAEAILAAVAALIEPDAAQLRYEPKEAARRLHMLTFAGDTSDDHLRAAAADRAARSSPCSSTGSAPQGAPPLPLPRREETGRADPAAAHLPAARTGGLLAVVVVLQLVGTIASLYLPSLNADIIDNGVAKGDTGYILRTGGCDARGHRSCRSSARSPPSTSAPGPRWASAATSAAAIFHRVGDFSAREVGAASARRR